MERLHVAFFGPTNSGKSTLVNALAGQEVSLASPIPGTTTDPVRKAIEIPGIGPCVLIDTAGLDDDSALGAERARLTQRILDETDVAVLLFPAEPCPSSHSEGRWARKWGEIVSSVPSLGTMGTPVVFVMTKTDLGGTAPAGVLPVSARTGQGIPELLERIKSMLPKEEPRFLTGDLVKPGDTVLLVMPQDGEAPKGRLILPQVQVIRELLDRGCNALCCTPESLGSALEHAPALVITDSQVFGEVERAIPKDWPLTSFSILLAAAKGDVRTFVEGAAAIDTLKTGDRVLVAEACTHVPDTEDIGRVKIPALLRRKADVHVDVAAGDDFPEDLSPYALVIHCGACVATSRLVRARTRKALLAGVPITNYGIALAKLKGILERVRIPHPEA